MNIEKAKKIYNKYKYHDNKKIKYFLEPYEAKHPFPQLMEADEVILFAVSRYMSNYIFTDKAIYYYDHFYNRIRRDYRGIDRISVNKIIGDFVINNDFMDIGGTPQERDKPFYDNFQLMLDELKLIFNTPSKDENFVRITPGASSSKNNQLQNTKKYIHNNIKEVFSDKAFTIKNGKLHADVNSISGKDVFYAVAMMKTVYAFFVDWALEEDRICKLRISADTKKNMLKKPYMRSEDEMVFAAYEYLNFSSYRIGFYISDGFFYYYYQNRENIKIYELKDIKRIVIYGDERELFIHFNDDNAMAMMISKDKEAVGILFCLLCYLKGKSGIYSLVRQIENFAKVNAIMPLKQFVTTSMLRKDFIDKMGLVHGTIVNPDNCIAGIASPTINMLLAVEGLYIYASVGNSPVQKVFIDGNSIKKAVASVERFNPKKNKTKKTAQIAGWIIGGPVGGMIGGWVAGSMLKKSQYFVIEINDKERLMMDVDTTLSDTACMCLVLNTYCNIGKVN